VLDSGYLTITSRRFRNWIDLRWEEKNPTIDREKQKNAGYWLYCSLYIKCARPPETRGGLACAGEYTARFVLWQARRPRITETVAFLFLVLKAHICLFDWWLLDHESSEASAQRMDGVFCRQELCALIHFKVCLAKPHRRSTDPLKKILQTWIWEVISPAAGTTVNRETSDGQNRRT
jgi:hypothetical protein